MPQSCVLSISFFVFEHSEDLAFLLVNIVFQFGAFVFNVLNFYEHFSFALFRLQCLSHSVRN
jgi:hypothetical protein